ncbi:MAG: C45 family peptidase [Bryobacteraceae bacterium]
MTRRDLFAPFLAGALGTAAMAGSRIPRQDARLKHAFRRPQQNGWIFVHLEGAPAEIGYQHGALLAPEILDTQQAIALEITHDSKNWAFFRDAAKNVLWPRVEDEYREELQGIVEGLHTRGVKLDLWDVVATNAWLEFSPYYTNWYDKEHKSSMMRRPAADHCSAFAATGSYTKDGKIVIGHNSWTDYVTGSRWNMIFDITPANGHRILMDGMAGLIHSGDDFGVNAAGIVITETTISQFNGFDPNGIPEFVRARKAMQYASSIDDFARIMKDGNNGGYANDWLVADRNTNEIASLELGLKNVNLRRSKDGYFVGSNYPIDPKLAKEETEFNVNDLSNSANARHIRWDQLMEEHKGRIDVAAGEKFLADHYDTFDKKIEPDERTLCGHIELSARGSKPWQSAYGTAGAVQNKVTDAALAGEMSFFAAMGHACGLNFKAAEHLRKHPEFAWEKAELRDLNSRPWTNFRIASLAR